MKHHALLVCALLLLAGCKQTPEQAAAPGKVETVTCGTIKQIHAVDDLYLASQPSAEDYKALKDLGIKTVIDLRLEQENRGFNEKETIESLGMAYVALPWNGADQLTDEKLDTMRKLLREAERPLLMKCGSSNRVGAGWLAYRVLDQGVAVETALAEAKVVGMRTPAFETITLAYIKARQ